MGNARNLGSLLNTSSTIQADDLNIGQLGNRNLIINGAMQVAQRGTSFSNPTANQYMLDRWFMGGNPTNLTVTQQSNVTVNGTISKTMRLDASGVSNFDVYQAVEDWEYLSNKTVTMSFWYRTNIDGVVLRQYNTATRDTLPTTNGAWQYRATTFSMGTLQSNPRGAGTATLGFWNSAASVVNGSYFEVTQVQLEAGDTATPFEHRSFGQELALCQRYFEKSFAIDTAPQNGLGPITNGTIYANGIVAYTTGGARTPQFKFSVTKRAAPTIVFYGPDAAQGGSGSLWGIFLGSWQTSTTTGLVDGLSHQWGFAVEVNKTSSFTFGQTYLTGGNWTASAEL
jgi:hypothetical protein